jgi:CheY-like chemotaxis protein
LTRQLLAFSRRQVISPQVLDLKVLLANMERMLRRVLGEDIELQTAADPDLWLVKADPGQVEQVLLNLCVNSRDAMPTGGMLTIEVRNAELDQAYAAAHPNVRPGPYVLLAVSDTGCGMTDEVKARIFEPFFTTKGEMGTGLGLATVYGIVHQSGGHIAVDSEQGRGTAIKAYLPRVQEALRSSPSQAGGDLLPRGTETLLLLEDEDGVRALTRRVLKSCGYTVLEAREGAEALRVAMRHQGRLDLLVSDVVLPRLGGREVAQRLAERYPGLKVLFLSGYTDDAVVRHGVREAEVQFLQKPYSPAILARKVRDVLDQ